MSSPDVAPNPAPAGQSAFQAFESKNIVSGSSDFLESNSLIAKIAFLLLVIIAFVILFRLAVSLLGTIFAPSGKSVLINGLMNGNTQTIVSQDPGIRGSKTVIRSINEKPGIEFTWSTWLFLNGFDNSNTFHHVFNKGNTSIDSYGIVEPNNAPGVYISPGYQGLIVLMNTFENPYGEIIEITDLPMNKWFNVMIRVQDKFCDVYFNGRLTKRRIMNAVVKQNYDNVNVAMNGGFNGYISNLTYFNKAIGVAEIQNIITAGPNLKPMDNNLATAKPRYLAERWFFDQNAV